MEVSSIATITHSFTAQKKKMFWLTKNLKTERGSPVTNFVCVRGAAADSIQIKDCHWFLPNESPTNITVLPFIFSRNSTPLNLPWHINATKPFKSCLTYKQYIFYKQINEMQLNQRTQDYYMNDVITLDYFKTKTSETLTNNTRIEPISLFVMLGSVLVVVPR